MFITWRYCRLSPATYAACMHRIITGIAAAAAAAAAANEQCVL